MPEEWRDVPGYEGSYIVSNLGNVKTLSREVITAKGRHLHLRGHDVSQNISKKGYSTVHLGNTQAYVHRLVAQAFIPNPDNLPQVNHKDECKTNNQVDNLEWCTDAYNVNYGTCKIRMANSLKGKVMSKETRKKLSLAAKGRKLSDEHKRKLSAAKLGKPFSDEHRKNLSEALKGNTNKRDYCMRQKELAGE